MGNHKRFDRSVQLGDSHTQPIKKQQHGFTRHLSAWVADHTSRSPQVNIVLSWKCYILLIHVSTFLVDILLAVTILHFRRHWWSVFTHLCPAGNRRSGLPQMTGLHVYKMTTYISPRTELIKIGVWDLAFWTSQVFIHHKEWGIVLLIVLQAYCLEFIWPCSVKYYKQRLRHGQSNWTTANRARQSGPVTWHDRPV